MTELYWCCREDTESLIGELAARGRSPRAAGFGNRQPLIAFSNPDSELLRQTLLHLASERIRSAAIMARPLATEELSLAAEWWRRLVVEKAEVGRISDFGDFLRLSGEFAQRDLLIFEVLQSGQVDLDEAQEELRPIAAKPVSAAQVIADPYAYYGDLADPREGGAIALFAAGQEAARLRGLGNDQVLVGDPETFGFKVDDVRDSVTAWRRSGHIAAEAVGFTLGHWDQVDRLLESHSVRIDRTELERDVGEWTRAGLQFGLAIVLSGLQDPPVVIPMGSVYQQPVMGVQAQNLAVAKPATILVAAGATVPLVLPAYCLNKTFSPPNGPVTPTPLVHTSAGGPQGAVWDAVRRRYRGRP